MSSILEQLLLENTSVKGLNPTESDIMEDGVIEPTKPTLKVKTERAIYIEILEMFKGLPCLWDPHHKFYNNRRARTHAFEMLLKVYRELEENANVDTMKKKIDNFRSSFKREWKKVKDAKERGEDHNPSLWYYKYLLFLKEKNNDSSISLRAESESPQRIVNKSATRKKPKTETNDECEINWDQDDDSSEFIETIETTEPPKKKERLQTESCFIRNSIEDDATTSFARTVGFQLQEMTRYQRCIAEKLISEVIFCGKMDQLTMRSCINIKEDSIEHDHLID